MSDSHGGRDNIAQVMARQIKKPDAIVFLGDGLRDIAYSELGDIPLYCVCGNCDLYAGLFGEAVEEELLFTLGGYKIMIAHGHRYGVKSGLGLLLSTAAKKGADIVLFGHTHKKTEFVLQKDNEYGIALGKPLYVMNPGSVGSYCASWGSIEIDNRGRILLSHGEL